MAELTQNCYCFRYDNAASNYALRYVTRLEEATEKAVKTSMIEAANELHQRVDRVISPEPGAINITVRFDSSWKTRDYYSNIGFGADNYINKHQKSPRLRNTE